MRRELVERYVREMPPKHRIFGHRRVRPLPARVDIVIATMAAVGFAGLLVVIMRSDEVRQILTDLVRNALTFAG